MLALRGRHWDPLFRRRENPVGCPADPSPIEELVSGDSVSDLPDFTVQNRKVIWSSLRDQIECDSYPLLVAFKWASSVP